MRAVQLRGTKVACAPTVSSTASPSQRSSTSQTPTASNTPSLTTSVTSTTTATRTQTMTQSQVSTVSQTPSQTGFPLLAVVDNTAGMSNPIGGATPGGNRVFSPVMWHAVSFFFPEVDPGCGPGAYALVDVAFPMSSNATLPTGTASFVLQVRCMLHIFMLLMQFWFAFIFLKCLIYICFSCLRRIQLRERQ